MGTIPLSNCQILNRKHFLSSTTSILLPPKSTVSMLRVISRSAAPRASIIRAVQLRGMADQRIENAAEAAGKAKDSSPKDPSIISSAGAIGKQFNPDGAIGGVAQEVGGPFDKDGAIGKQFDAAKDGLAGQVEKAVDGPSRPASEKK